MAGELYKKLPRGVLARCLSLDESIKKLKKFIKIPLALAVLSVSTDAFSSQDIIGQKWANKLPLSKNNAPTTNTLLIKWNHMQSSPQVIGVYTFLSIL